MENSVIINYSITANYNFGIMSKSIEQKDIIFQIYRKCSSETNHFDKMIDIEILSKLSNI